MQPGEPRRPAILNIEDLSVAYRQGTRLFEAVRQATLSIRAGETYGLVGESGSGKTTLALAIMRYLGPQGVIQGGKIEFSGQDVLKLAHADMQRLWGKELALVPQNPQSALNPAVRVGEQISEVIRHHLGMTAVEARVRTLELFDLVGLPDPARVMESYPHQISGGMQQRIMIAMALSAEPQLLILDEPTTSLDVTTQAVILDLVRNLIRARQTAALYVTHNLGVVAQVCDRVAVMYAGEIVEDAGVSQIFQQPLHPYTIGLLDSVPRLGETKDRVLLRAIPGQIPPLGERPSGCVFRTRCPVVLEICERRPPLYSDGDSRSSRCHRWEEIAAGELSGHQLVPELQEKPKGGDEGLNVLHLDELSVEFPMRRSVEDVLRGVPVRKVQAVGGVSLAIERGKTLGLVGESGSGKTTIARTIMGLTEKSEGDMQLFNHPLPGELAGRDLEILRRLQMVFQNPEEALNPYLTVGETLRRPFVTLLNKSQEEADNEIRRLMAAVRLPESYLNRLPEQLSGGELQRVAIARAFAANPDVLVCDEPVSSLDVSVQASILNLLNELQGDHGSSLLFISHNLAVVGYLADEIAVIYLGHLMEVAKAAELFQPPFHPYTEALLASIPLMEPHAEQTKIRLKGEIPSSVEVPAGCPFHTRCPRFLGEICKKETPPWRVVQPSGKRIFCHIPEEELRAVQTSLDGSIR